MWASIAVGLRIYMSSSRNVTLSTRVVFLTRNRLLGRLLITTLAFGGAGWLGATILSRCPNPILVPARDELVPAEEIAGAGSGLGAQIPVVDDVPVKINIEAFNKKRERDIAEDSRKLVSLAIELKSEVNSESELTPETVHKVKEIEKLAHKVKETMTINMAGPI
jgi:hypothetical protein